MQDLGSGMSLPSLGIAHRAENDSVLHLSVPIASPRSGVVPVPNGTSTIHYLNSHRGYIYSCKLALEQQFAGFMADAGYVESREIPPL